MNNSRFKFRTWDEHAEVMIYSDQDYDDKGWFGFENGILKAWTSRQEPTSYELEPIEQYINQKDKNGANIYEGDILLHENGSAPRGVVRFVDGSFVAEWKGGKSFQVLYQRLVRHYNIIGNIDQNPELLER